MNQHVMRPDQSERTEYGLTLTDAQPLSGIPALWRLAALLATLLMGVLALIAALHFGRSILLPVAAALIVGITLAPVVKFGSRFSIPQPVSALLVVMLVAVLVGLVLTFFAAPLSEWISRAPEIGKVVQEKLRVLDYPLSVLREIRNAVMPAASHGPTVAVRSTPAEMVGTALVAITPAVSQFVLFFGTLVFFLATNSTLRQKMIIFFVTRNGRLRMIKIWNDIERNLVSYVGLLSLINLALGVVTTVMLYLVGFPNPVTFGLLITVLNYVPYRAGDLRAGAVLRRADRDALAAPGGACARAVRPNRHHRGPFHHTEHRRAPAHHQSVPGLPRARVLGLAVGADRGVSRHAAADRVVRGARPCAAPRRARCRDNSLIAIRNKMELFPAVARWRPDIREQVSWQPPLPLRVRGRALPTARRPRISRSSSKRSVTIFPN